MRTRINILLKNVIDFQDYWNISDNWTVVSPHFYPKFQSQTRRRKRATQIIGLFPTKKKIMSGLLSLKSDLQLHDMRQRYHMSSRRSHAEAVLRASKKKSKKIFSKRLHHVNWMLFLSWGILEVRVRYHTNDLYPQENKNCIEEKQKLFLRSESDSWLLRSIISYNRQKMDLNCRKIISTFRVLLSFIAKVSWDSKGTYKCCDKKILQSILRAETQTSLILRNWYSEEAKSQIHLSKKAFLKTLSRLAFWLLQIILRIFWAHVVYEKCSLESKQSFDIN